MEGSDVARLKAQIAAEYQAVNRLFTDFTPTARHELITKRQERIASCFEELQKHMPPQEAMAILAHIANNS